MQTVGLAGSVLMIGLAWMTSAAVDAEARQVDDSAWETLVPNARRPAPQVVSGGQPSAEQLKSAREAGFRTVINLRGEGEPGAKGQEIEALGMEYRAFPIASAEDLNEENARAFSALLADADGPVLLHCGSGNRVGALFALSAFYVDGATPEEALEKGLASGLTGLEPVVRQRLGVPGE
ncbi:MAG: sulfur transferase domain-containing protein [Acidobacteriota bacterium]